MAFLLVGCARSPMSINSFDGLGWGTTRDSIIELRGQPGAQTDDQLVYAVDEDFYGFTVDRHYFGFSGPCSDGVVDQRVACDLQHGGYRLKSRSQSAITDDDYRRLQTQLTYQYGTPEVASETSRRLDANHNFLANARRSTATFVRDDGSYIQLYRFDYDRDHYWNQLLVSKDIQLLTLWFVSAEYAKQQRQHRY